MEELFQLQVLTPASAVYRGEVSAVQLPVADGTVGVMARHAPMLCAVVEGVVRCTAAGGEHHYIAVGHGVAHVSDNEVTVLVGVGEQAENIDLARAQAAERRARERLRKPDPQVDAVRAKAALHRALARQMAVRLMKK